MWWFPFFFFFLFCGVIQRKPSVFCLAKLRFGSSVMKPLVFKTRGKILSQGRVWNLLSWDPEEAILSFMNFVEQGMERDGINLHCASSGEATCKRWS